MRILTSGLVPLVAALGVLLAACGDDPAVQVATLATGDVGVEGGGSPAERLNSDDALLAFATCMRDQGVDFADPVAQSDGTLAFTRPGGGDGGGFDESQLSQLQAARDACSDLIEGLAFGGPGGRPNQGEFDSGAFVAFAQCMRDNGVEEYPDPPASGRPDFDAIRQLDTESDAFVAASRTCSAEVGLEGRMGGGPPGSAGG